MASCPIRQEDEAHLGAVAAITPRTPLHLPMHRAFSRHWMTAPEGGRELVLFYRDKEISFDDPRFFAFGEALIAQGSFLAQDACNWGEGYRWDEVAPLLKSLIEEGIVELGGGPRHSDGERRIGECPNPLPPAATTAVHNWQDCSAITTALTGQPLELAHLEMVVPPYRLAHLMLDADGRQVGEANVFPPALRLDIPTRWAACNYSGSRFQAGKPMNVTALKAMRAHWGTMMAIIAAVREAYLRRFPEARDAWTVGHVERLTSCLLGLANYEVMRPDGPADQGELHPAVSSVYRISDGVRMVTHQMMFIPTGEGAWHPDQPIRPADLHDYAERNFSFHSDHGVCAGPRAMIDEFLHILIDGVAPAALEAPIDNAAAAAALAALEPAIDYALLGLQVHAVTYSLWPQMGRSYEAIAEINDHLASSGNICAQQLAPEFAAQIHRLRHGTYFGTAEYRRLREAAYGDMFAQSARGVYGALPERGLTDLVVPRIDQSDLLIYQALNQRIETLYQSQDSEQAGLVARLAHEIFAFHKGIQIRIQEGQKVQDRINALLGRDPAATSLSGRQFWIAKDLVGSGDTSLASLVDFLEDGMDVTIRVEAAAMELT